MSMSDRHYYKEVRLRQMRALVEIAKHGSFAEAARKLALSSPAVWQQVRALEREFDADLVTVRAGEALLTEEGELLTSLATPLIESFDGIRSLFAERRGKLERRLTVVTTTALLTHELPYAIARYRKAHPNVELTLMDRPSLESRGIFERGSADIAIIGAAGQEGTPPNCKSEELTRFTFHLVCPQHHPLLAKKRLKLEDIAQHPLILAGQGAAISNRVPEVLAMHGIGNSKVAVTSTNLALTISYVQMGYGIAIVPVPTTVVKSWMPSRHRHIALREVSQLFGHENIIMLHRTSSHELQHVKQFRETVLKQMQAE